MTDRSALFDESKATGLMDLYSRQIGTFGVETMKNLTKLRVLIIGFKGVGIETAKNLILAGPGAVTIYDNNPVVISDLGTNFYFSESDVGKRRSEAALDKLKELNPLVEVSDYTGELIDSFLLTFGAIVVTDDLPFDTLVHIDKLAHANFILFLYGVNYGVAATIFADFGPSHRVTDLDGEPARINVIDNILVQEEEGKHHLVITVAAARHGLDDDAIVQIYDVEGMSGINDIGPIKIHRVYKKMKDDKGNPRDILVLNKLRIDHDDIPKWGQYKGQGMISEVKPQKELKFHTLDVSVKNPLKEEDMGFVPHPHEEKKYTGRGAQVHFTRLALWQFQKEKGHLPRLHNEEDANVVVEIAKQLAAANKDVEGVLKVEAIDEKVVKQTSLYSVVELPGITAFLGGVLAQEVIKKFGKYTPIQQWLHLDYLELLSDTVPPDAHPQSSRYDHQIAVFGKAFQEKLGKQTWFMVGCGALGCEYLKGFALMGLGTNGGKLYVTDMDTIEVSNLSRQFLFRRDNVGKLKSVSASAAAAKMNPHMNIKCFDVPVGFDTENKFNDPFWSSLDGVCNALDNIKAREYTDSKCVFYGKPLLESGTLGTKANSEMVIPFKTKSYAEHEAAGEEETIPMCTLRNFPHLIEHCIEWARAQFTDLFESPFGSYNKYAKNPQEFLADAKKQKDAEALDLLENVSKIVSWVDKPRSFENCIHMAFQIFLGQFRDRILNLVHAFPANSVKEDENGVKVPFWSGSKRFPRGIEISFEDKLQFDFLFNTANLYAVAFGIRPIVDPAEFAKHITSANIQIPEWHPDSKFMAQVQSEVKEEESKHPGAPKPEKVEEKTDEQKLASLFQYLESFDKSKLSSLSKAEFEKDDDTNFHIDFITSCSNLRAWNYHIPTATRHKCKMIAGRIIPAVATTTAMITGIVEIEFYKLILGLDVSKFCNSNINLAVSDFKLFEPIGPKKAKEAYDPIENEVVVPIPTGWTVWDKVVVDKGDLTVKEFLEAFTALHHGCKLTSVFFRQPSDGVPIWVDFPITDTQKEMVARNITRKLSDIYLERHSSFPEGRNYLLLDGSVLTAEEKPAIVPPIMFVFKSIN